MISKALRASSAAVLGVAVTAATAIGGVTSADAATVAKGKVQANGGLVVRSAPSRYAGKVTTFANGTKITISCKVHGTSVDGNDLWYLNAGEGTAWLPARYVANVGAAPRYCNTGDSVSATITTKTNIRRGPTTSDTRTGSYAKGAKIKVVCVTRGQRVGSTSDWFYTSKGRWVIGSNVHASRTRICAF